MPPFIINMLIKIIIYRDNISKKRFLILLKNVVEKLAYYIENAVIANFSGIFCLLLEKKEYLCMNN